MKSRTLAIFGIGTYILSVVASATNDNGEPTMPVALIIASGILSMLFVIMATIRLWHTNKIVAILLLSSSAILFTTEIMQELNHATYGSTIVLITNAFRVIGIISFIWAVVILWKMTESE